MAYTYLPWLNEAENLMGYFNANQPSGYQTLANAIPYLGYTQNLNQYTPSLNNKRYKQFYQQFRQQGQQNIADMIAEASRQNRKASAMGRTPLFSPERGGETIFREMMRGYQDNQHQASQAALSASTQALKQQQQSDLQKADVWGNIGGALTKMFGL
jgi:hypothetical protein